MPDPDGWSVHFQTDNTLERRQEEDEKGRIHTDPQDPSNRLHSSYTSKFGRNFCLARLLRATPQGILMAPPLPEWRAEQHREVCWAQIPGSIQAQQRAGEKALAELAPSPPHHKTGLFRIVLFLFLGSISVFLLFAGLLLLRTVRIGSCTRHRKRCRDSC